MKAARPSRLLADGAVSCRPLAHVSFVHGAGGEKEGEGGVGGPGSEPGEALRLGKGVMRGNAPVAVN